MIVDGTIELSPPVTCAGCVLTVRLLDISRADASSITLAEAKSRAEGEGPVARLPFALEVDTSKLERRRCSFAAQLDRNGDGKVSKGDFVTMQSYPWTAGAAAPLLVLKRVM